MKAKNVHNWPLKVVQMQMSEEREGLPEAAEGDEKQIDEIINGK
jgi:hypothetical protein